MGGFLWMNKHGHTSRIAWDGAELFLLDEHGIGYAAIPSTGGGDVAFRSKCGALLVAHLRDCDDGLQTLVAKAPTCMRCLLA